MEKTTTQRIIGIVVVIALVIILLPLLFDKNEATAKVTAAKAPPFPEQPVQAEPAMAAADQKTAPAFVDIPAELADQINQATESAPDPLAEPQPASPSVPAQPTKATQPATQPASPATQMEAKADENKISPEQQLPSSLIADDKKPITEKIIKSVDTHQDEVTDIKSKPTKHIMKMATAKKTAHTSFIKFQKTAWAIQLGSFKNKENARRLADKLRASGYKAFMHEIKSASSVQTRVYIGPEYKQASAEKLSSQLAQHMNIHGLVIPYKPLDL